ASGSPGGSPPGRSVRRCDWWWRCRRGCRRSRARRRDHAARCRETRREARRSAGRSSRHYKGAAGDRPSVLPDPTLRRLRVAPHLLASSGDALLEADLVGSEAAALISGDGAVIAGESVEAEPGHVLRGDVALGGGEEVAGDAETPELRQDADVRDIAE